MKIVPVNNKEKEVVAQSIDQNKNKDKKPYTIRSMLRDIDKWQKLIEDID
jgi:hypothetical protein